MLFNSLSFLIFFPTVVMLYFLLQHRFRWALLLISSYTFYMFWRIDYAIILIISTLIDYLCGRMMNTYSEEDRAKRKPWLWISLLSNLGILFVFKYYNFFNTAAKDLAEMLGMNYAAPALELLLPMGISFYTFQTMAYSIDVYYDRIKAEKHLGIFALFVTFFPQLVAGPIERAGNLLGQLKERHKFNYQQVINGLMLMAWGMFKKVVIADRIALVVNYVYNYPSYYEGIPLIIATVLFAFQVYCDFSGYSDIAVGAAQVMGFNLMRNFRRPFFAKSIKELWSRWHISLSTWFRDYLYIPLGGNRVVKWRWYYNIIIMFLLSGLWHGANWTYIAWGASQGFYLAFGEITKNQRNKLVNFIGLNKLPVIYSFVQIALTFILFCFSLIFFRANSISEAWYIISHLFSGTIENSKASFIIEFNHLFETTYLGQPIIFFLSIIFFISLLLLVEAISEKRNIREWYGNQHVIFRWGVAYSLLLIIIICGMYNNNEFIYFQF